MATAVHPPTIEPPTLPPVAVPAARTVAKRYIVWTRWAMALLLLIAGIIAWQMWHNHTLKAITLQTVALERGTVQASVAATGLVYAVIDVLMGSQVSGKITALYTDFNSKATSGQLVALIEPAVFQTVVDQALAAHCSSLSAVDTATAQISKASSDISGSMAGAHGAASSTMASLRGKIALLPIPTPMPRRATSLRSSHS